MKIYTKAGDEGFTTTMGGRRVPKDDPIIKISGRIDYLQAGLDFVHAVIANPADKDLIEQIQQKLWQAAGELSQGKVTEAIKDPISEDDIAKIENKILSLGKPPTKFARFSTPVSLYLNEARVRTRALESELTHFLRENFIRPVVYKYINRLSDLFFMMAYALEEEKVHHELKKEKKLELRE